jgi:E3 ubiquitin-protein ligase RNF115/126
MSSSSVSYYCHECSAPCPSVGFSELGEDLQCSQCGSVFIEEQENNPPIESSAPPSASAPPSSLSPSIAFPAPPAIASLVQNFLSSILPNQSINTSLTLPAFQIPMPQNPSQPSNSISYSNSIFPLNSLFGVSSASPQLFQFPFPGVSSPGNSAVPASGNGIIQGDYLFGDDRAFQSLLHHLMNNVGGHRGTPPTARAVLEALKPITVTEELIAPGGALADKECSVCLELFSSGEPVLSLPCGHSYHDVTCIRPWLIEHSSCPTCRYPLPTDDPSYEMARQQAAQQQMQTQQNQQ